MTSYQYRTDEDGTTTFAGVTYSYSTYHVMPQDIHKVMVREGPPLEPKSQDPKANDPKAPTNGPTAPQSTRPRPDPAQKAEENVVLVMYEHEPVSTEARESLVAEAVEILMSNGFLQDRRSWSLSETPGKSES